MQIKPRLVEWKRGGDGGWVGRGLWCMCVEDLHVETRKRISNYVVCARNVLCRDSEVVHGSSEEEVTEEVHDVRAVRRARYQAPHYGLVVTEEADTESGPPVAPCHCCQHNGVELLPLDAVLQLCLCPPAVEPLSLTVGAEPDGAGTVCEQLEVGGGGPLW